MDKKKAAIYTAALIIPFGLVALGLWETYKLIKQKRTSQNDKETEKSCIKK